MNSFFNGLAPLLQQCTSMSILLTMDGDKISLVTTPVAKPGAVDGLKTQLVLKGTVEELDEGFLNAVMSHVSGNKDIIQQIETNRIAQEAEKNRLSASKTASKPVSGARAGSASVTSGDIVGGGDDEDDENDGQSKDPSTPIVEKTSEDTSKNPLEIELF